MTGRRGDARIDCPGHSQTNRIQTTVGQVRPWLPAGGRPVRIFDAMRQSTEPTKLSHATLRISFGERTRSRAAPMQPPPPLRPAEVGRRTGRGVTGLPSTSRADVSSPHAHNATPGATCHSLCLSARRSRSPWFRPDRKSSGASLLQKVSVKAAPTPTALVYRGLCAPVWHASPDEGAVNEAASLPPTRAGTGRMIAESA